MSDSAKASMPISPSIMPNHDLPPGDHPLEIAARQGFGPLSPKAETVWHGQAMPCVTCGELVHREDLACEHCDQDLSEEMLAKMRAHAGPWYVLEHVRPFPGVTLDLIIRQIQRGLITETSIIRGPATDYQWRFAVETPGLCRYFGRCWKCHAKATSASTYCEDCLSLPDFPKPRVPSTTPATGAVTPSVAAAPTTGAGELSSAAPAIPRQTIRDSLSELTAAIDEAAVTRRDDLWDEPPRVGPIRATWIAIILLILTILVLIWIVSARTPLATTLEQATPARRDEAADSSLWHRFPIGDQHRARLPFTPRRGVQDEETDSSSSTVERHLHSVEIMALFRKFTIECHMCVTNPGRPPARGVESSRYETGMEITSFAATAGRFITYT